MGFQIVICLLFALFTVVYGKDIRVSGGRTVNLSDFPYLASLKRISNNKHFCGAAIISVRHVVTVALCVDEKIVDTRNLEVRAGIATYEHDNTYLNGYIYKIDEIYIHPQYSMMLNLTTTHSNNIAVIRVRRNFEFNYSLNMIELPTSDVESGKIGTLVGWGKKSYESSSYSEEVQKAWMMILDSNSCLQLTELRIRLDQFCGFQTAGVGACTGDSGSPLVIDNKLVGIVALYKPGTTGIPDVYMRIYSHLGFINSIIN